MPLDFRADQIQVGKLIPSASNGTNAKLLIYSASADAAPYNQGNINSARFNTSAIGTDTFIYISGTRATSATTLAASTSKAVFGGDLHASGSIVVEGFGSGDQNVLIIGNRTISTPNGVSNNDIAITAGTKSDSTVGGSITISAGNGTDDTSTNGGTLYFKGGQGAASIGNGGDVTLVGGPVQSAQGPSLGSGGNAYLGGGSGTATERSGFVSIGEKIAVVDSYTKFIGIGIDSTTHITGSDKFFIVSGTVNGRRTGGRNVAVFEGDLVVSGNLYVSSSISGSHHKLYDGLDFLVAGTNIAIVTGTNGQVTISSTGGSGGNQWVEGIPSPRLRTTASVSISSLSEFAENKGSDIWFWVSGTQVANATELTQSMGKKAVFGGDVLHSGSVIIQGLASGQNKLLLSAGSVSTPSYVSSNDLTISVGEKTSGTGGGLTLSAGNSPASGGQFILSAGNGTGTGESTGGAIYVYSGYGSDSGDGGSLNILAANGGDAVTVTSAGNGGDVTVGAGHGGLTPNSATSSGRGGNLTLFAGNSNNYQSNPVASQGGTVSISAGQGATALSGDNPAGDGGTITIIAGPTGFAAGTGDIGFGGNVLVSAGYNANSNNDRAGYIGLGDKVTSVTKFVHVGLDSAGNLITGSDQYFIVSGTVNGRRTGGRNVAVFQGDVVISGNLFVSSSISGSHHKLYNGLDFLVAGNNVTIVTGTNGQVTISATTGSSSGSVTLPTGSLISLGLVDYKSSNATDSSPEAVGQYSLDTNLYTGSIYARFTLATTNAAYSASIQLANISLGQLVEIGGPGITKLTTNNTTPTLLQSVDLKTAGNFTSGEAIYEVRVFTENSSAQAVVGGGEFRVTASLASSIPTIQYVAGTGFPDTPLPRLEWVSDSLVTVVPSVYSNPQLDYYKKPIRITFQDGIQRTYTSANLLNLLFITSSVVGQYGVDTVTSIAARGGDQYYYCYLVPSGTNSNLTTLSIIASTTSPSGVFSTNNYGPDGYTNFRYIGALFYKTSGKGTPGFEVFKQNDSKTFLFNNNYSIYSINSTMDANASTPTIPFNLLTSSVVAPPGIVSKLFCDVSLTLSGANVVDSIEHQLYANGALSAFTSPSARTRINGPYSKTINSVALMVGYVREYHSWELKYRTTQDSTAWPSTAGYTSSLTWNAYEDQYLGDYIPTTSLTASI